MPFEAKFLNLSTDNYKCLLLNPLNYEITNSIELDETAILKMNCPFEKLVIIMKNQTNPNEELLFDLPQCELYTIDKDFSQAFTIIKSDKQGKRFEGVYASKNLKFTNASKNKENLNQKIIQQENEIEELKAANDQIETKEYFKANCSPNTCDIYSANNKPVFLTHNANCNSNYNGFNQGSDMKGNNDGFYLNYNQIPAANYINKYYSRNSYNQNVPLNNYHPTEDKTNVENKNNNNNYYYNDPDLFKQENIYVLSSNSQYASKSQIESTSEKYQVIDCKSNNAINNNNNSFNALRQENNDYPFSLPIAAQANNDKIQSNTNTNMQTQNYHNQKEAIEVIDKSAEKNSEQQIKSDLNPNPSLKLTENNSGYTYTLDTFDLNKFLKELNLPSANLLIDSKDIKSENTIFASPTVANFYYNTNNNNNILIKIEKPASNYIFNMEKIEQDNKPKEIIELNNNKIIEVDKNLKQEISKEDKNSYYENKVSREAPNVSNLTKSAVIFIGAESKIDDKENLIDKNNNNDTSFNAMENKNNLANYLNKSAYINGYDGVSEKYNAMSISSKSYCSPEELKKIFKEEKHESNLISNNSSFVNATIIPSGFDSKSYYLDKENIKAEETIIKPILLNNSENSLAKDFKEQIIQDEKEQSQVKSEETKIILTQESKELINYTPIVTSNANNLEEKKLPATLIDFNIDDYLKNILKEYETNFGSIPSLIPVEAEIKELKIEPLVNIQHTEEKPVMSNTISEKSEEEKQIIINKDEKCFNNPEVGVEKQEANNNLTIKQEEIIYPVNNIEEKVICFNSYKKNQNEENSNLHYNLNKIDEANNIDNTSVIIDKELKIQSPIIEKTQEQPVSLNIQFSDKNNTNHLFTFKKSVVEIAPLQETGNKTSEFILSNKSIEFPTIEAILGSSNINIEEILNPNKNNENKTNENSQNILLDEINYSKIEPQSTDNNNNIKSENINFVEISTINLQTDINLPAFTLKDIPNFEENYINDDNIQAENFNFIEINQKLETTIDNHQEVNFNNKNNEEFMKKEIHFNIPEHEEAEKQQQQEINKSSEKDSSIELYFKEKSFEKNEEIQFTLDPNNNSSKRNSFIIEKKAANDNLIISRNGFPNELIKSPELKSIFAAAANAPGIDESFEIADENNRKEKLVFYPKRLNEFYESIKNFDKTILGIIFANNFYDENTGLFHRGKTANKITLKNNSDKAFFVRLTKGKNEIQALKPNTSISLSQPEGEIYKLQISLEAEFPQGPVFNVFPGCDYSIENNFLLFDSNKEQVSLSGSAFPDNDPEPLFNIVLFTFLECENLKNLSNLGNLTDEDLVTFVNATAEKVLLRIKADGENTNEDYYCVYPLMAISIQRKSETELLSEIKTGSQKIMKFNLATNNVYILDEDHTLVRAFNNEIIESLQQIIKFSSKENTSNKNNLYKANENNQNENNSFKDSASEEEEYFDFNQTTEFDEENLNEFNIENASAENLYVRLEQKVEGKDAFFLLKSTQDIWTVREDGLFLCEIVRTNLSSRRFIINTSYCYEIDQEFNLIESVTKKLIKRTFDKLPGKKLIFEGVHAQINYDLDFDFDMKAEYFQGFKPKYIKGNKFVDEYFPPKNHIIAAINPLDKKRVDANNPHSLEKINEKIISCINFKRSEEIFKGQKLFLFNENNNNNHLHKAKEPEIYYQSYISSIIATLNQIPALVKSIFKSTRINKDGFYEIYFYENNKKKVMFIDDYFPVLSQENKNNDNKNNNLQAELEKTYFTEPSFKSEIWLQILEKAYAKYEGGYANITDGNVSSEIYFYTGAISINFPTKVQAHMQDAIWENLLAATAKTASLFSSSFSRNEKNRKLVLAGFHDAEAKIAKNKTVPLTQFTYSVLACDEFDNGVETVRLIKLKNPAGPIEWMGDYAKGSGKWSFEMKIYFEADKAFKETGVFFLCFEEFVEQFDFFVVSFV